MLFHIQTCIYTDHHPMVKIVLDYYWVLFCFNLFLGIIVMGLILIFIINYIIAAEPINGSMMKGMMSGEESNFQEMKTPEETVSALEALDSSSSSYKEYSVNTKSFSISGKDTLCSLDTMPPSTGMVANPVSIPTHIFSLSFHYLYFIKSLNGMKIIFLIIGVNLKVVMMVMIIRERRRRRRS